MKLKISFIVTLFLTTPAFADEGGAEYMKVECNSLTGLFLFEYDEGNRSLVTYITTESNSSPINLSDAIEPYIKFDGQNYKVQIGCLSQAEGIGISLIHDENPQIVQIDNDARIHQYPDSSGYTLEKKQTFDFPHLSIREK